MSEVTEDFSTKCVEVETAWKEDSSEENPEAETFGIVIEESSSFSGSLALIAWSAGSGVGLSWVTASLELRG